MTTFIHNILSIDYHLPQCTVFLPTYSVGRSVPDKQLIMSGNCDEPKYNFLEAVLIDKQIRPGFIAICHHGM